MQRERRRRKGRGGVSLALGTGSSSSLNCNKVTDSLLNIDLYNLYSFLSDTTFMALRWSMWQEEDSLGDASLPPGGCFGKSACCGRDEVWPPEAAWKAGSSVRSGWSISEWSLVYCLFATTVSTLFWHLMFQPEALVEAQLEDPGIS